MVDGQPLMRQAIGLVVRSVWPKSQVSEAGSLGEMTAALRVGAPIGLVVLDPALPEVEGLSALVALQKALPGVPVVVFSSRRDGQIVTTSYILGAAGFISKAAMMSEMAEALGRVAAGERVFPAGRAGAQAELLTEAQIAVAVRKRLDDLSATQLRVLINIADGRLNKQVAADMNVTEATIKAHMSAIFRKLKVHNRAQAILAVQPLLGRTAVGAIAA
ncbi:hypothetical protein AS593_00565 [Caulobacter vibrioides]|nr:hypothetical protein AS593_00565 [Caulobacter vibrioides]